MALNSCCCCVPLRTGALLIATMYLVVNICAVLGWAVFTIYSILSVPSPDYEDHPEYYQGKSTLWVYVLLALVGFCGLNISMDSLLLRGIRKNHRKYMLPWVIWYCIFTTCATSAWLGGVVYLVRALVKDAGPLKGIIIFFLSVSAGGGLVFFTVMWYWYACVTSYYVLLEPSDHYAMEPLRGRKANGDVISSPYLEMVPPAIRASQASWSMGRQ